MKTVFLLLLGLVFLCKGKQLDLIHFIYYVQDVGCLFVLEKLFNVIFSTFVAGYKGCHA